VTAYPSLSLLPGQFQVFSYGSMTISGQWTVLYLAPGQGGKKGESLDLTSVSLCDMLITAVSQDCRRPWKKLVQPQKGWLLFPRTAPLQEALYPELSFSSIQALAAWQEGPSCPQGSTPASPQASNVFMVLLFPPEAKRPMIEELGLVMHLPSFSWRGPQPSWSLQAFEECPGSFLEAASLPPACKSWWEGVKLPFTSRLLSLCSRHAGKLLNTKWKPRTAGLLQANACNSFAPPPRWLGFLFN
jgi:hypothetical protein